MIVRIIAVVSLGRMFTVDLSIRKDHQLKTDGLYRYIRHPAYLGLLLAFYGLGLAMNNVICFFIVTIPITIIFVRRLRLEEALLEEEFGSIYISYRNKTKSLVPFVY
jgi:protein-S-isoprenylcysteine O-methyltransferase Ste14